ncbi:MAG TPA: DUF47 family protein [Usitatibacter sp.]|nr:DUF47 family protein [Usitatibacter sp.]
MEKSRIIEALGEDGLRLPAQLNEALEANDRAKYLFSVLQVAQERAEHPERPLSDLGAEGKAAGIGLDGFQQLVASATKVDGDRYLMPGVDRLCVRLYGELSTMIAPLNAAGTEDAPRLAERLRRLSEAPWCDDDYVSRSQIAAMTSAGSEDADTLHRLVMDAHRNLNALQARIAAETIDGAHVYGIRDSDRALIAAFMSGLNRTSPLKFDHPGLGTTATRSGSRLLIQNDIGTTDAHVIVVHVEGLRVTMNYTDVHMQRLLFFQGLFERWAVDWDDTLSRADRAMEDGVYHLCLGTFTAASPAELEEYLAFLGSRLVFLIDWNRARKRLRLLLPKKETADLLKWAAQNDYGHMAFLRAGGEAMVFDALAYASQAPAPYGSRLDELLGREVAEEFMRYVIRVCAQGFAAGRSEALVRDEVRAELMSCFRSAQESALDIPAEHAAFTLEIASGIRDALLAASGAGWQAAFEANAARAKAWERRADELVERARNAGRSNGHVRFYRELVEIADDVADELEEAAFHLTLAPARGFDESFMGALRPLAALAVESAQEYVKAVESARTLSRASPRDDRQDFLEAIHRIMSVEHRSDEAHRASKSLVARSDAPYGEVFAFVECARNLEAAADSLMHAGLALRDFVLREMAVE